MFLNSSDPANDWVFAVEGGSLVRFEALERIAEARKCANRPLTIEVSFEELLEITADPNRKPVFGRRNVTDALRYAAGNGSAEILKDVEKTMCPKVIRAAKRNLEV
jgi:predicted metalloprotease